MSFYDLVFPFGNDDLDSAEDFFWRRIRNFCEVILFLIWWNRWNSYEHRHEILVLLNLEYNEDMKHLIQIRITRRIKDEEEVDEVGSLQSH
jgi:hypothetical protein